VASSCSSFSEERERGEEGVLLQPPPFFSLTSPMKSLPFCREVIERRPEDHKIECLKQIRALFPADYHPLHAGFGNKSSVSERENISA